MATQLLCPRCKVELPASFSARTGGVCPNCQAAIVAKRSQGAKRSTAVLMSKPHRPPADVEPAVTAVSRRSILVAAALIASVPIVAGFCLSRTPDSPQSVVAAVDSLKSPPTSSITSSPQQNPTIVNASMVEPAVPSRLTKPKVRIIGRDDAPAIHNKPFALTTKSLSLAVDSEKLETAIRKGRDFLIANKHRWLKVASHETGYAALPGLALLEVGVAADDPIIDEAAAVVRRLGPSLRQTYEISLAILFLDRLGDPADESLIRSLALRLIAGQTANAGWDYPCPLLASNLEMPLTTMLERLRPEGQWQTPLPREAGQGLVDLAIPLGGRTDRERPGANNTKSDLKPMNLAPPLILGDAATTRDLVKDFPAALRSLPIVDPKTKTKGGGRDDNSNTQFALLALWTARRHGVSVDRSLLLGDRRFAKSQNRDGAWGYHFGEKSGRPSMTCVGLLGLALGHGAMLPDGTDAKPSPHPAADPAIQRGLEALGKAVGDPKKRDNVPAPNLYFLWSLERVAMMYQLPTIGGKDWFGWGANHILSSQRPDGSWSGSDYPGSAPPLDTAFALLFLHRSNLVQDLTQRLQLHMAITDQERK